MLRRTNWHRRWWAVAAAAVVVVLVPATSAQAALPPSGSWSAVAGPQSGTTPSGGSASWDVASGAVTVRVEGYGMAAGHCQTTYFDWETPARHHDLRGVRTCMDDSVSRYRWVEPVPVSSVRKLRVCYGPQDDLGSCSIAPGAGRGVVADWSGARGRDCVGWVLVSAAGEVTINSGGDPRRCDA